MDRRTFLKWSGGAMALPLLQWPGGHDRTSSHFPPDSSCLSAEWQQEEEWSPAPGSTERDFTLGPFCSHWPATRTNWCCWMA